MFMLGKICNAEIICKDLIQLFKVKNELIFFTFNPNQIHVPEINLYSHQFLTLIVINVNFHSVLSIKQLSKFTGLIICCTEQRK